ncbi:hypothetical protein SLS62_000805 [Diatrype stigma]|uniref:Uncharacterized protein n=1 Tax=Diatrype stigma TaxID=117547 RepID=A0AAN9V0H8_9PEZI
MYRPFMATIAAALAISAYMVLSSEPWLMELMQLTPISSTFKGAVLVLGCCYLLIAWTAENHILPGLARKVGQAKLALLKKTKKRKEYKIILERARA